MRLKVLYVHQPSCSAMTHRTRPFGQERPSQWAGDDETTTYIGQSWIFLYIRRTLYSDDSTFVEFQSDELIRVHARKGADVICKTLPILYNTIGHMYHSFTQAYFRVTGESSNLLCWQGLVLCHCEAGYGGRWQYFCQEPTLATSLQEEGVCVSTFKTICLGVWLVSSTKFYWCGGHLKNMCSTTFMSFVCLFKAGIWKSPQIYHRVKYIAVKTSHFDGSFGFVLTFCLTWGLLQGLLQIGSVLGRL